MSRQTIKDPNQRALGYIETFSDGRQKATDKSNRILGNFDPRRDGTTAPDNQVLARANVLSGLSYDQR